MNKKNSFGHLYKTTCLITGKIYIGQSTKTIGSNAEKLYLGSGSDLMPDIKLYGRNNFKKEILLCVNDQQSLNLWETYFVRKFNACDPKIGYNILAGPPKTFFSRSKDYRVKIKIGLANKGKLNGDKNPMRRPEISSKFLGENNNNYGAKAFTEDSRKRISEGKRKWLLDDPSRNPMKNPVTAIFMGLIKMGYPKDFFTKVRAKIIMKWGLENEPDIIEGYNQRYYEHHRYPHSSNRKTVEEMKEEIRLQIIENAKRYDRQQAEKRKNAKNRISL